MHATIRTTSTSRRTVALVLTTLIALLASTGCDRAMAGRSQTLANEARNARGTHSLVWDEQAATKAQAWANHLASQGSLAHSRLTDGMSGYSALAENVGYASSVEAVHDLLMNSSQHRKNILGGQYTSIGVGVAQANGSYYVVQVFKG